MWSAPVFVVMLFGALLLAGWLPPPSPSQSADQVATMYAQHTDLKRLPLPEEVAQAIVFLASDRASAVTGQCLSIDCGEYHN